jgi:hypothetical protein
MSSSVSLRTAQSDFAFILLNYKEVTKMILTGSLFSYWGFSYIIHRVIHFVSKKNELQCNTFSFLLYFSSFVSSSFPFCYVLTVF